MVRYSREDALSEKEFVLLLNGADKMKPPRDLEARFVIYCSGRLGMRGGEIAHIKEEWLKRDRNLIKIPRHSNCNKGKFEGEVCGYCRRRIKDYLESRNLSIEEAKQNIIEETPDRISDEVIQEMAEERVEENNLEYSDVVSDWWKPKTNASARSIPYDFNVRLQMCINSFFEDYSKFPLSKSSLNRRIEKAKEKSDLSKRIYPHSLRATAATTHASRDVSPYALMSIMGWRDMDTARKYISASDESAAIEIRSAHR